MDRQDGAGRVEHDPSLRLPAGDGGPAIGPLGRGPHRCHRHVEASAPRLSGRSTIATIVDQLCPGPPKRVPLVVPRTLLTPTCSPTVNRMAQYSPAVVDRTFSALADANRRQILDRIGEGQVSISELAEPLHMSLPGVLKHVRALEEAHLVVTAKRGRTRWCRLAERPLDAAAIGSRSAARSGTGGSIDSSAISTTWRKRRDDVDSTSASSGW